MNLNPERLKGRLNLPLGQDKDAFERRLAYVWQDGVLLNEKLVREGYVLWVTRSPNHKYDQRLARAQEWARLMGVRVWNPEQPMRLTPAEFRRTRDEGRRGASG